jgi:DNA-binding SARP family transcriptional activator
LEETASGDVALEHEPERGSSGVGVPSGAADHLALAAEAFEAHVHALLVVDPSKRVIAHNTAAERLLGPRAPLLTDPRAGAACRLVGCDEDGPLAGGCLFERTLASRGALPELEVDLPGGAAALVVTTAMPTRPSHVLVGMRPADRMPMVRSPASGIAVVSLGLTQVWSGGSQIGAEWLPQRPGELFKYLISQRGRPASAEEIAEQLWPEAGLRAVRSVRYYVHALRKRLEPFADQPPARSRVVLHERGRYLLSTSRVALDADEFEAAVRTGRARFEEGDVDSAVHHLAHAVSLYGGDFLADEPYAEWAITERDRLRSLAADALRTLSTVRAERNDLDGAAVALERLAELEPFDLDVHRELITMSMRRGRRSAAVRRYEALRRRMLSTFGEDVDFLLSDVAQVE